MNGKPSDSQAILNDELGDGTGFLEVAYREIFANHMEQMLKLHQDNVTDSEQLLRVFAEFSETDFKPYLNAEAGVLRKSKDRSNKLREQGNKAYSKRRNEEALKFYTDAIRFAPYTISTEESPAGMGEELALAYANRSAVLVEMGENRAALSDINLAFVAGYPQDLEYKLLERKGKCLTLLWKNEEAKLSYNQCLESLNRCTKLDEVKKEKIISDVNNKINSLNSTVNGKTEHEILDSLTIPPRPIIKETNKKFPAFSSAVKIQYSKDRGRYGIASRDIPLGELLCVEAPTCFFLHEETTGLNCSNCFRKSLCAVPSPLCTQNIFCSTECQREGMKHYHFVESKFMDVLFQNGLQKKEYFLALRSVTRRPLQFFLEIQNKLGHNPLMGTDTKDENGEVYDSDDFMTLYNLVSHHDSWDFKEHAYKAYFALFFIRCLQKSNYFGEYQSKDRSLGAEEILIGKILIHLMEVATMNAHEIGQLEAESGKSWLLGQATPVGCALEPTLVLLNHSCTPTLVRVNNGTETYCFASRHIKKGEEITDSYTFSYDVTPKIKRSPVFKNKYKFTCVCPACQEDWDIFQNLPKGFNDLSPDQLKIKQQKMMKLKEYVERIQKLGAQIHKHQQNEEFFEAMKVYPDFLKALDAVIKPPHQFYAIARRSYSSCLWIQHGSKVRT